MLPLVALGGILVVADLAWLARMPGSVGAPHLAEAATGPALIVLGGWLGVLLGRVWRSVAVAPLVLVALAVGSLTLAELQVGGHDQRSWIWLGTLLRPVTIDPPPAALLGRPATWHLVYLLGAAVVLGALAVWRSQAQARARRRTQAVTGAVLVAALAVTTTAAVVQTRPTSAALAARREAAASNPAAQPGLPAARPGGLLRVPRLRAADQPVGADRAGGARKRPARHGGTSGAGHRGAANRLVPADRGGRG